jgi:hypothetical protein
MSLLTKKRYASVICEQLGHKSLCGKALHFLTYSMHNNCDDRAREVAKFVIDIITLESFRDVPGSMKSLLVAFTPKVREEITSMLDEDYDLNSQGELVDSDEDSQGNLRDFIEYSEEDEDDSESGDYSGSSRGSIGKDDSEGSSDESRSHIDVKVDKVENNDSDSSTSHQSEKKIEKNLKKNVNQPIDTSSARGRKLAAALADTDDDDEQAPEPRTPSRAIARKDGSKVVVSLMSDEDESEKVERTSRRKPLQSAALIDLTSSVEKTPRPDKNQNHNLKRKRIKLSTSDDEL